MRNRGNRNRMRGREGGREGDSLRVCEREKVCLHYSLNRIKKNITIDFVLYSIA